MNNYDSIEVITESLDILAVEDEEDWRNKIKEATKTGNVIDVKFAEDDAHAIKFLESYKFDVVSLDSRFNGTRRIHNLITKTKKHLGESVPIIALTRYPGDITTLDKGKLFSVIDKAKCMSQPKLLRQTFSDAISNSLSKQSQELLGEISKVPMPNLPDFDVDLQKLLSKWQNYKNWLDQKEGVESKDILELYGCVLETREDEFDVVLYHEKGEKEYRTFPADRFKDDGFSQDDCFRYTIVRKGTRVISNIEKAESTLSDDELDELRNFDMSKFDKFQYNPEESDEQDKGE